MKSAEFVNMINKGMALEGTITKEKANNTFYKATHFLLNSEYQFETPRIAFFFTRLSTKLSIFGIQIFFMLKKTKYLARI